MLTSIFPRTIDNTYRGQWLGLAFFCLVLAIKLIMSVNSIANTRSVLTGADGIPLDAYGADGAQAVLSLFGVLALSQLALASVALIALVRYRAMVPLMLLVLLVEHCARRVFLMLNPIERADGAPVGFYINLAIAAALLIGFSLSIWTRHRRDA
jgi:hypothetical protein